MTTDLELLGDLAFTRAEFVDVRFHRNEDEITRDRLVTHCNRILAPKLVKAPEVFWPDDKSAVPRFRDMGTAQKVGDTHSARLVCIKERK